MQKKRKGYIFIYFSSEKYTSMSILYMENTLYFYLYFYSDMVKKEESIFHIQNTHTTLAGIEARL
jgi:hypothetical protein